MDRSPPLSADLPVDGPVPDRGAPVDDLAMADLAPSVDLNYPASPVGSYSGSLTGFSSHRAGKTANVCMISAAITLHVSSWSRFGSYLVNGKAGGSSSCAKGGGSQQWSRSVHGQVGPKGLLSATLDHDSASSLTGTLVRAKSGRWHFVNGKWSSAWSWTSQTGGSWLASW